MFKNIKKLNDNLKTIDCDTNKNSSNCLSYLHHVSPTYFAILNRRTKYINGLNNCIFLRRDGYFFLAIIKIVILNIIITPDGLVDETIELSNWKVVSKIRR